MKLNYDAQLSNYGFKLTLRRYSTEVTKIRQAWAEAVKQIPIMYPGVEIIMVNPSGLTDLIKGNPGVSKLLTGVKGKTPVRPDQLCWNFL